MLEESGNEIDELMQAETLGNVIVRRESWNVLRGASLQFVEARDFWFKQIFEVLICLNKLTITN